MPSPVLDRKLRFSDAVYAIGATPKSLRKWLQNDELQLVYSGQKSGWHDFSFADLAVLAIMRPLVDFGLTVGEASDFSNVTLMGRAKLLMRSKNTPPQALAAVFKGVEMRVWHEAETTTYLTHLGDKERPAAAFLSIDLGTVLKTAFDRAVELQAEGAET